MPPEVSVIIPNYDRHGEMERAVDSVLSQEEVEFELLVVDDASNDPPLALYERVEVLGHRVLRGESRLGPGPCRNRAAELARGEYLALLDSDDYWLPGKLSRQLASLRSSGLRIGQVEEVWIRNGVRVNPLKVHRMEAGDLFERSLRAVCVSPSSVLLERSLFLELGGFDEELFVCEDYDLWLRAAVGERFHLLEEALVVKHGGHADQLSRALPAMDRFRVRCLLKGLRIGLFGERWALAAEEAVRKIGIMLTGAEKRGETKVASLCRSLLSACESRDWKAGWRLSGELLEFWPARME